MACRAGEVSLLKYSRQRLYKAVFVFIATLCSSLANSHPLPDTNISFHIATGGVFIDLKAPLRDFELVCGNPQGKPVTFVSNYFKRHLAICSNNGTAWEYVVKNYIITTETYDGAGRYKQIRFNLEVKNPQRINTRDFVLTCDAFVHQIYNHKSIITVDTDWENGIYNNPHIVGYIARDATGKNIAPFHIVLDKGSYWKGFKSVVILGFNHIAEGTDHILFLLSLLLVAPFIIVDKKWQISPQAKYVLFRILKITGAFTLGHSLTLIIGALGIVTVPPSLVEVFIALTIVFTGINIITPLFKGNEIWVTFIFGLVHGLAFAYNMIDLNLASAELALSILGFNLGIEILQILIILVVLPVLIVCSRYKFYAALRPYLGYIVVFLAVYWLAERLFGYI